MATKHAHELAKEYQYREEANTLASLCLDGVQRQVGFVAGI